MTVDTEKLLTTYDYLSKCAESAISLCKDTVAIQFLIYMMDSEREESIVAVLNILINLSKYQQCRPILLSKYGVKECIKSLAIKRSENKLSFTLDKLSLELEKILIRHEDKKCLLSMPPTIKFLNTSAIASKIIIIRIYGLVTIHQRQQCELKLVSIKGVISITFDMKLGTCTCRVKQYINSQQIVDAIESIDGLSTKVIVQNHSKFGSLNDYNKTEDLPKYLPEEDYLIKEKALISSSVAAIKNKAGSLLGTATNFLQRSFYW